MSSAAAVDPLAELRLGQPVLVAGDTQAARRRALAQFGSRCVGAARPVFTGVAVLGLGDCGVSAVYDAVVRAQFRRPVGEDLPLPRSASVTAWAQILDAIAGQKPHVLCVDAVDLFDRATEQFFRELAGAMAAADRGYLVINPLAPVDRHPGGLLPAPAVAQPAASSWRLHPVARQELARVAADEQQRQLAEQQAIAAGHLELVDGVWLPSQSLESPKLRDDHSELMQLQPLSAAQRRIMQSVAVLGPVAQLAPVLGWVNSLDITALESRGLMKRGPRGYYLPNPVLARSIAAGIGAARTASLTSRVRAPGSSGRYLGPDLPRPMDVADLSAASMVEYARWAVVRSRYPDSDSASAQGWWGLAAVVLAHRAQLARSASWLSRLPVTEAESLRAAILSDPQGQLARLPWPQPTGGYFAEYHQLLGLWRELRQVAAAGQQDQHRILDFLSRARRLRAVVLWAQAAQLARTWQLTPGATPVDGHGADDVQAGLLSALSAGLSSADCGRWFGLSVRSIEKRISTLFTQHQVSSRVALIAAARSGQVPYASD